MADSDDSDAAKGEAVDGAGLDALQELLAIEGIKRLKASYFCYLDEQEWEQFAELLTEDFVVIFAVPQEQFYPPDATEASRRARASRPRTTDRVDASERARHDHCAPCPHARHRDHEPRLGEWTVGDD